MNRFIRISGTIVFAFVCLQACTKTGSGSAASNGSSAGGGADTAVSGAGYATPPVVGQVTTVAGNGTAGYRDGTASSALFNQPGAVAVDAKENLYVADVDNYRIRKITSAGVVTTLAGNGTKGFADGTATNAEFSRIGFSMAVDGQGNIYVADMGNNRIRKITSDGTVSTVAGNGSQGNTDGAAANATFNGPTGVVLDAQNNIYVADAGNNSVREISTAGIVSTVAQGANLYTMAGIALDSHGTIYVAVYISAVGYSGYDYIAAISSSGAISDFAGPNGITMNGDVDGTTANAMFGSPVGLVADAQGNLYVGDGSNYSIRKISAGQVTTLAGAGFPGYWDSTDSDAEFESPWGLAVDANGNVFVADAGSNAIREIRVK